MQAIELEEAPEDGEFDFHRLKEIVGLFLRAPRRRPGLAVASLLVTLSLGVLAAVFWPRSYSCEVRILAQRDLVLPALGNPNRAVPRDADSLTRNAADTILQRDNIMAMIKQLDLVDRWVSTRQPALRLKDRIVSVFGPRSDEDRLRDLVGLLEKRLVVGADESSITISVEWPDRQTAFDIITFLQKNFLEARYDANVNVISEAIRILEGRAKPEAAEVDGALAGLTRVEGQGSQEKPTLDPDAPGPGRPARAGAVPVATAAPAAVRTDGAAKELEDLRQRMRLVKEDHDRHLMEAQNQLSDARTTLGPLHPTVLGLSAKVAQLAQEPAEVKAGRARERELVGELAAASLRPQSGSTPTSGPTPTPATTAASVSEAPDVILARSKLQAVSARYSDLLSRIEAANIELETTRAAFKYQYSVVRPPELPREPSKPNSSLVLLASIVAAVLLTFLVPGGVDLSRARFVETWQVERWLKMPVLGQLSPPS